MARSAAPIVKGYLYQFQLSAIEILRMAEETDSATFEASEDLEITTRNGTELIQYKHQPASFIDAARIRFTVLDMLRDFSESKGASRYRLVVHSQLYSKVPLETVEDIRRLARYKSGGVERNYIEEHGISARMVKRFVENFRFEMGPSFEESYEMLIELLMVEFKCSREEAATRYYPAAIELCIRLASGFRMKERSITRGSFRTGIHGIQGIDGIGDRVKSMMEGYMVRKGLGKFGMWNAELRKGKWMLSRSVIANRGFVGGAIEAR